MTSASLPASGSCPTQRYSGVSCWARWFVLAAAIGGSELALDDWRIEMETGHVEKNAKWDCWTSTLETACGASHLLAEAVVAAASLSGRDRGKAVAPSESYVR